MTKGYLDIKELETYQKADLQALARKLGVSDKGTVKELAARCAGVEVETADEDEQVTTTDGQQETAGEDQQPEQPQLKEDEVAVEALQTYKDLELKRIVNRGERLPMKKDRAAVLVERKLVKLQK